MKKKLPTFILKYCIFIIAIGITGCSEKSADDETRPPLKAESHSPGSLDEATPEPVIVTEKTRETYQWYCAQCHGVHGKGDGINSKFLTVPPRNHTKASYLETRTDEQFFEAIKFGGLSVGRAPCMPAWGNTLSDSTIHELVRYIRELCQCEAL
jgi:cytochrome c oxidase cbb3-type subunit III